VINDSVQSSSTSHSLTIPSPPRRKPRAARATTDREPANPHRERALQGFDRCVLRSSEYGWITDPTVPTKASWHSRTLRATQRAVCRSAAVALDARWVPRTDHQCQVV
jgi:hypothetical protein